MALIALAVLVGMLVFLFGLVTRRRRIIMIGAPAVVIFVLWLILASIPPSASAEFGRLFGVSKAWNVTDVKIVKPTFMDGYFLTFGIATGEFNARIRPQLSEMGVTSNAFLR